VRRFVEPLTKLGYVYVGQAGIPHQRLFVKGPERRRTHFVHCVEFDSRGWQDYLLFRKALRRDSEIRKKYLQLKRALWKRFPKDRASYTRGKKRFINSVVRRVRRSADVQ
jgi:GrpB-like predicted nucleotidyltransferase (UPF0157 family)